MKFGTFKLADAEGAVLAHALRLADGKRLKKGTMLGAGEIAALAQSGIGSVIAARLEAGDTGEDEAARRIAEALVSTGIRAEAPSTGNWVFLTAPDGSRVRKPFSFGIFTDLPFEKLSELLT